MRHTKIVEFWVQVEKTETCWVWKGKVRPDKIFMGGYGDAAPGFPHRISYELAHGPVPKGLVVMHLCNNKLCVNPTHLRAGTNSENMKAAWEDGRCDHTPFGQARKGDKSAVRNFNHSLEFAKINELPGAIEDFISARRAKSLERKAAKTEARRLVRERWASILG